MSAFRNWKPFNVFLPLIAGSTRLGGEGGHTHREAWASVLSLASFEGKVPPLSVAAMVSTTCDPYVHGLAFLYLTTTTRGRRYHLMVVDVGRAEKEPSCS